ncbi:nucleotidyltransferase domain-containing protein [Natrarchaeobaculum aegyptiacum]|uniref:Nucleotidyltransferase family protein n=1 Tax=Natrarchaeobaculum aegyptiacum TaxID=745377 RepID=A0A2Z2HY52_9EURY|nr:nucleotidyltransferase family protein [Natrarchaeobaculum aegyptiacum]ARS89964.1 hypothetical protein B1756_09635 [Natrarchaeobaculum aegyptiacum]
MGEGCTTETQFVVQCLRAGIHDSSLETTDFESVDWDGVLDGATRHTVSPLVYEALQDVTDQAESALETGPGCKTGQTTETTMEAPQVPTEVLETFRERSQFVARRNLRLLGAVANLSSTLQSEGIRAIPYRGPVIASHLYGDVGCREFRDVDVLVAREDIPAIKSILEGLGFEPVYLDDSVTELTPTQEWAYRRVEREYTFYRERDDLEVELHWRVLSRHFPTEFDLECLWDRRSTTTVAGTEVPVFSPEDRLLACCIHGSRHRWERLHWSYDVAVALENQPVDWDAILERAQRHDCRRLFLLGLAVTDWLYDVSVPDRVRRQIATDQTLEGLLAAVEDRLFTDRPYREFEERRFQARTLDRTRDRVAFWANWLFKPNRSDVEAIALPRPLAPLYGVVRPVRIATGALCNGVRTSDHPQAEGR